MEETARLYDLALPKRFRARRISSYDRADGNDDWVPIPPRATFRMADIGGPGVISHLYFTINAEGAGYYIGCNLSMHNLYKGWWGEGDDMIFVDGEAWPPSLHGTGTEEYFGQGWGMQDVRFPYFGLSYHDRDDFNERGKVTVYRFHAADPVPFTKSLRVTIEHGHANDRSDDWASTAYWYQYEPHAPFPSLPDAIARRPNP